VRWHWVAVSPVEAAEPPPPPKPAPHPPSLSEAARILEEAWKDLDWGTLLWLAVTTGVRRGELCALRRSDVDLDNGVLHVDKSVHGSRFALAEKDTKTHQQRRIALDPETVAVVKDHLDRTSERAAALGVAVAADTFLFSLDPDAGRPLVPESVSQRYDRLVKRLGIDTTLHKLRHYNATELISAGVDLRTIAGRLGHGGGGTTTLRVYAAWLAEADRRAALAVATRLPKRPAR
jgi:integrase